MSSILSDLPSMVGGLNASHTAALSILVSYFLLIFLLFSTIISSVYTHANFQYHPRRAALFGGLTLASFAHTWFWMFRFMIWSFRDFENVHYQEGTLLLRMATWLVDTALFEQAWSTVCMGPLQWWWSEQLCLFTAGAFTVFLFTQRGRVPHVWAYMLLGQVVAISVAWSLLNLALILIPRPRAASNVGTAHLPATLTVPVLLSLLTVSVSPYTTSTTFLPNLLVMHALLIVPLLPLPLHTPPRLSPRSTSFYTLVALLSIILRLRTTFAVLSLLHVTSSPFFSLQYPVDAMVGLWNAPGIVLGAAWETLHIHPAQASIGWDVVWSSLVWIAWGVWGDRATEESRWTATDTVMMVFPVVVASVGITAPMEFGRELRAGRLEDKNE